MIYTSYMMNRSLIPLILLLCLMSPLQATAQGEIDRAEYSLAPGDTVYVRVYGEDDLTMRLAVPGNGAVSYAFVGDFELKGKTVNQVEQEIYQRLLGDYLVDPQISVSIAEFRDFFIQGAVAKTGGIPWQPGLTVCTAITLAGGLKDRASKSKWYLVPEGGSENDRRKVSEDDPVNPGDTLIVEESFF